ncbi:hypothetical protein J7382_16205 [Shimia sp. R11_0]|uniref:DUF6476 family protein n=1 Tax=Shimia sp. R11_0 TaxID=2821096 RepID=UPI001ADB0729|nr:DUF6476 family protein [Shimia sp. R11_0]MBO9479091.1 hypothetical protein [Shimia sp. R11_0]
MDESPEPIEPANLRFLRLLVTGMTGIMVVGLVTLVVLLVMRFRDDGPILPENLTLEDGAVAQAVTMGDGWVAIVTTDNRILIHDRITGARRQEIILSPGAFGSTVEH